MQPNQKKRNKEALVEVSFCAMEIFLYDINTCRSSIIINKNKIH